MPRRSVQRVRKEEKEAGGNVTAVRCRHNSQRINRLRRSRRAFDRKSPGRESLLDAGHPVEENTRNGSGSSTSRLEGNRHVAPACR